MKGGSKYIDDVRSSNTISNNPTIPTIPSGPTNYLYEDVEEYIDPETGERIANVRVFATVDPSAEERLSKIGPGTYNPSDHQIRKNPISVIRWKPERSGRLSSLNKSETQ